MLHVWPDIISRRMYNWPCDTQGLKNNFSARVSQIEGFGFLFSSFQGHTCRVFVFETPHLEVMENL